MLLRSDFFEHQSGLSKSHKRATLSSFFFFFNPRFQLILRFKNLKINLTVSDDKSQGNLDEHGRRLAFSINAIYLIYKDFHAFKNIYEKPFVHNDQYF